MSIRPDKMVVQFDEGLPNPLFRYTDYLSHQDHEWKKDFRDNASQPMRQEDILPPQDGEDEQKTAEDHEEDQKGEGETEDKWKGGMNGFQPNHGNIPKEEDEKEENDTGKDEQSNEDSLLRPNLQRDPLKKSNIKIRRPAQPVGNHPRTIYILTNFKTCHH